MTGRQSTACSRRSTPAVKWCGGTRRILEPRGSPSSPMAPRRSLNACGLDALDLRTTKPSGEAWDFNALSAPVHGNVERKPSETTERMAALQEDSNTAAAAGVQPVVISSGGGGSKEPQGEVTVDGSAHTDIPSLPDGPSSSAQADYFYRLPLGGVL